MLDIIHSRTAEDVNVQVSKSPKGTPTKNNDKPDEEYYDKRGAILSARKRTRSSTRQQRPKLSDDLDPGDSDQETVVITNKTEDQEQLPTPNHRIPKTPNKNVENIRDSPDVRRSPRKHPSSSLSKTPGFSKLTISGSTIVNDPKSSAMKRQASFTILDPASGVPSDGTPRLQASLTSRHSALMLPGNNFLHMSMSSAAAAAAAVAANFQTNHASFLLQNSQTAISVNSKDSPLAVPVSL